MTLGNRETEIKVAVPDAAAARRLLRDTGFRIVRRRVFESNILFDTPGHRLRTSGSVVRVREVNGSATLTYKGPAALDKHKSREELEVAADDAHTLQTILERLGFEPVFRYEKYRTEFRRDASGIVTLDETTVGVLLEIEGPPRWIDRTARRLGFTESDYVTAGYWTLHAAWCASRGRKPGDMVFNSRRVHTS